MVAYNPADPLNWKWIKQQQDDLAAGANPDGSSRYTINPEDDPEYQAYLSQFTFGSEQANADAELRRTQARIAYEQALEDMQQQGLTSKRDMDTSLLGRGVYQSGERGVRDRDLQTALGQGRARADQSFAGQVGGIDSDLQRALGQFGAERERQIVMSRARISQSQRDGALDAGLYGGTGGGAGGGGGNSSTTQQQAAPTGPAPVPEAAYTDAIDPFRNPNPPAPPKPPKPGAPTRPLKPRVGTSSQSRYM